MFAVVWLRQRLSIFIGSSGRVIPLPMNAEWSLVSEEFPTKPDEEWSNDYIPERFIFR